MMQWAFLGLIGATVYYAIHQLGKPKVVMLPPVGPVIFNPAPETGSNTFLGDITGHPGMYWNITTDALMIPGGFTTMSPAA